MRGLPRSKDEGCCDLCGKAAARLCWGQPHAGCAGLSADRAAPGPALPRLQHRARPSGRRRGRPAPRIAVPARRGQARVTGRVTRWGRIS